MGSKPDHDIVYVAVPMTDGETLQSAPTIFVPSNERDVPSNNASRSFVKAAVVLSLGFVACTFIFLMVPHMYGSFHHLHLPKPCHHHLRGSSFVDSHEGRMHHPGMSRHNQNMKHHEHPGKHLMMHEMMHPGNDHGVEHHDHQDNGKRWKNVHESSSSSEDGWYAGNASHDGWHVSLVQNMDRSSSYDGNGADNFETSEYITFDESPLGTMVERVEVEKEDGTVPGLP